MERTKTMEMTKFNENVKYEYITINKNNLDLFEFTDYKRNIRQTQLTRLLNILGKEKTFKNPIHVNKVGDKYRIIDGNHRMEAVKVAITRFAERMVTKNKIEQVRIPIAIHFDLSEEEERELFDDLAKTVPQTNSDYIRIHSAEIPIIKRIENSFPIRMSIYSNRNALSFSNLFIVWRNKENDSFKTTPREELVEFASNITDKEYHEIKEFFSLYSQTFGLPDSVSPYYKALALWIVTSFYFRNRGFIPKDEIWEYLKKKLYGNVILLDVAKARNKEFAFDARRMLVEKLNQSWRGNPWI